MTRRYHSCIFIEKETTIHSKFNLQEKIFEFYEHLLTVMGRLVALPKLKDQVCSTIYLLLKWEQMESCLYKWHYNVEKYKQPCPWFKLRSLILFPMTITVALDALPVLHCRVRRLMSYPEAVTRSQCFQTGWKKLYKHIFIFLQLHLIQILINSTGLSNTVVLFLYNH